MAAAGHHRSGFIPLLDHRGSVCLRSHMSCRPSYSAEPVTAPVASKTSSDRDRRHHAEPRRGRRCLVPLFAITAFDTGSARGAGTVSKCDAVRDLAALDGICLDLGSIPDQLGLDRAGYRQNPCSGLW